MTSNNPRPQQPVKPYYAPQLQQRGMVTLKSMASGRPASYWH